MVINKPVAPKKSTKQNKKKTKQNPPAGPAKSTSQPVQKTHTATTGNAAPGLSLLSETFQAIRELSNVMDLNQVLQFIRSLTDEVRNTPDPIEKVFAFIRIYSSHFETNYVTEPET